MYLTGNIIIYVLHTWTPSFSATGILCIAILGYYVVTLTFKTSRSIVCSLLACVVGFFIDFVLSN